MKFIALLAEIGGFRASEQIMMLLIYNDSMKRTLLLVLMLLLVACAPTEGDNDTEMKNEPDIPSELTSLVADVRSDATKRSKNAILSSITETTWNDGSLGCPQDGMMYTMALVDGYKIVFEDGGKTFNYHTDGSTRFIFCES